MVIDSGNARQPFNYSVGLYGSKFFKELKENKRFLGVKCPKCSKVYIPPRKVCGECFIETREFVEVGPRGKIGSFTILRYAFIDPETGEQKPVPYGYGFIRLDGADTLFQHYINISDENKVKIGAIVEPVFAENRKGTIRDILHFNIVD
ncbi:MAG: Zn-ribbon domain-containing OB-fold protein [Desulfobacterales bacterium]|nr:Zn-ribbon domain-containing OB-fold protein [Desulfobacterales bacterium]MBF0396078.1 Zn-ribbon domain-containing OB-fold protein [Desulfobacterales bacterium]